MKDRWTIRTPMLPWNAQFSAELQATEQWLGISAYIAYDTHIVRITPKSPLSYRRAAEQLGLYFRREGQFHCNPYHHQENAQGVLFLMSAVKADIDDPSKLHVVGSVMFNWMSWANIPACWTLTWAWLHPFARRRGLLRAVWPGFQRVFEPFLVQPPYSLAMERFLQRVDPERLKQMRQLAQKP